MKKIKEKYEGQRDSKNPIKCALYEYIEDFGLKFSETKEAFKKTRLYTSDRKEKIVQDFFSSFFPQGYEISRGEIFDYNGISNSIDCVIKSPGHPSLKTPMRPDIILAEGVYAAIEVKPDISNKTEFNRALAQCKSVKKLTRDIDFKNLDGKDEKKTYKKIPFILFSKKAKDIEETTEYIIEKIEKNKMKPIDVPDIIFSLDGWLIYHTTNINLSLFEPTFKQEGLSSENENVFMLFKGDSGDLLCILLLLLYHFPGPEHMIDDFIVKQYLLKLYDNNDIVFSRAIWY